jgi:hypothetical protein
VLDELTDATVDDELFRDELLLFTDDALLCDDLDEELLSLWLSLLEDDDELCSVSDCNVTSVGCDVKRQVSLPAVNR